MATEPVTGAARYYAAVDGDGKNGVVMVDGEGFPNFVQNCRTAESAKKAAERWQAKENKATAKAARG